MIGTAQYLSPEQARGDEVTAASDCYAVGIVLYEMLTGRVPFDGGPPVAVAMKQISDKPVSPRIVEPSVPRELETVVMRALAKRPSERYLTAERWPRPGRGARDPRRHGRHHAGDPRRRPGDEGDGAGDRGDPRRAASPARLRPSSRRRWPMIAGILVVLLAIAAGAFVFFSGDEAKAVTMPPVAGQRRRRREEPEGPGPRGRCPPRRRPECQGGEGDRHRPAAGQEAHEGDTVILRVSAGPGDTPVPDVTDKTVDDATALLRAQDFTVKVQEEASDNVNEGLVIRSIPGAGENPRRAARSRSWS